MQSSSLSPAPSSAKPFLRSTVMAAPMSVFTLSVKLGSLASANRLFTACVLHTLLKACSSVTTSGASPPPFTAMAFSLHFSANCCGVTFWAAPSAIATSALSPPVVSLDFCLQLAVNVSRHSSVMNNFFISQVLIISIQLLILQIYHFILRNRPFIPLFYTIPPSSQRKAPITPAPRNEEVIKLPAPCRGGVGVGALPMPLQQYPIACL